MAAEPRVMGLFADDAKAARAIRELAEAGFTFRRAHGPILSERIREATGGHGSPVGWFTLAGGIFGFAFGFALAIFTASQWNLIVSGKPVIALVPFLVVGFECTILFSVLGNVVGLLVCTRLPDFRGLEAYDPRCSGDRFGVLASCPAGREGELLEFFRKKGAEVRVWP